VLPRVPRRPLLLAGALALIAGLVTPAVARQPAGTALSRLGVGHVWLINVENKSYAETYGGATPTYLNSTLRRQGGLLEQYYGIGHLSLDNYIAQLSGQAPTLLTQSDCQVYVDVVPGVAGPDGQAIGQGCVYPASVKTLPDQLDAVGKTWKGYMEDMGNDPSREPDRCGAPPLDPTNGMRDGTQTATATDQYAARHNPFVYFHSILDRTYGDAPNHATCVTNVVPLTALATDLAKKPADVPNFNLITPNLCDDGHDDPCVGKDVDGGTASGLKAVDLWLQKYIPMIEASRAFQQDGLIIVSGDEAESSDSTSCCNEESGYNTPLAGGGGITSGSPGPGGGRIGTLVIGHGVKPDSTSTTAYNHYSLLRSLEDLFGVTTGGADGQGHLGYAGATGLVPFGKDVFQAAKGAF
jgi:hypothetical protein